MTSAEPPPSNNAASRPRILVVEDDLCSARLYTMLLEKDGYAVTHCSDGQAALEILEKERFDGIVLDLMMPKVDGIQVLKSVRASTMNPLVPVIILTAARLKVVEEEALRLGARHFLDKTQSGELLVELRKIMDEKPATADRSLRLAPPSPIQPKAPIKRSEPVPALEEPKKPATATGWGWFFK